MLPALIGAGASLLGGIFGRNSERKAIAAQNEYNNPANIRARAEAAGFNPLLFVGPGVGNQMATGGSNFLGSAIADAGLMLSEALAKRQDLRKLDRLKDENEKLSQQVTDLTIRPKIGGIYAQREAIPSKSAALGAKGSVSANSGGQAAALAVAGQDALFGVDPSDPVKPDVSHTYKTYGNDGHVTNVPLGPDIDEVISGATIALVNRGKRERAARGRMNFGVPLSMWDGIEMPPNYQPTYPKSKKDRFRDYWWGGSLRDATRQLMAPRPSNYW